MARIALDSSVMVAAVCAWHERHAIAAARVEGLLSGRDELVVPAHALVEAYAVLTRLPAPHRLAPADAWALVDANFVRWGTLATLPGRALTKLLASLAAADVGGGRTCDALIAEAAVRAGADTLITLNPRHFSSDTMTIEEPR